MARYALTFAFVSFLLWISANSAPSSRSLHLLPSASVQELLSGCKSKKEGCAAQSEKDKNLRAAVKLSMTRDLGEGHAKGMSEAQAEELLVGVQTVKNALMTLNSLTGVVPRDNGLLGGDRTVKSKLEIQMLLGRINDLLPIVDIPTDSVSGALAPVSDILALGRKKRGDSLALDYYRGNRWPSNTINVFIDPKIFSSSEAKIIRDALKSITSQCKCITFVERTQQPLLEFVKVPKDTGEGTCGWSSVGYQKGERNDINLNFASSICRPAIKGVIVHETLHALGLTHEHTRNDRDKCIRINWNNVDAQSYDVFEKDDPNDFNPYGGKCDVLSIMMYDVYVGAANPNKKAFSAIQDSKLDPKIGNGETMTANDALLLKRLYCSSSNCRDTAPTCGWRALNGECSKISSACPKSCGICDKTFSSG